MNPSPAVLGVLVGYYDDMETGDPARYGAHYAEDMTLTFGNNPTITGRGNVVAAFADVLDRVSSLHHDVLNLWEQADGVVVYESLATWRLFDGSEVAIKACTVLTLSADGDFADQRIYVDNAPLFAALG